MNVLTLDLGTTTGWASVQSQVVTQSGIVKLHPRRFDGGGIRYLKFSKFLDDLESRIQPITAIFYEEVKRHIGVDAAHAYGGFMAVLTAWCESRHIAYEGVTVGTIKKHITGKGNANKQQVINAVKQLGHQPQDDNESDAIAIAYWAIHNRLGGNNEYLDSRTSCTAV